MFNSILPINNSKVSAFYVGDTVKTHNVYTSISYSYPDFRRSLVNVISVTLIKDLGKRSCIFEISRKKVNRRHY